VNSGAPQGKLDLAAHRRAQRRCLPLLLGASRCRVGTRPQQVRRLMVQMHRLQRRGVAAGRTVGDDARFVSHRSRERAGQWVREESANGLRIARQQGTAQRFEEGEHGISGAFYLIDTLQLIQRTVKPVPRNGTLTV
jgi:hypothetical protein